jgi:hypothetical protein
VSSGNTLPGYRRSYRKTPGKPIGCGYTILTTAHFDSRKCVAFGLYASLPAIVFLVCLKAIQSIGSGLDRTTNRAAAERVIGSVCQRFAITNHCAVCGAVRETEAAQPKLI